MTSSSRACAPRPARPPTGTPRRRCGSAGEPAPSAGGVSAVTVPHAEGEPPRVSAMSLPALMSAPRDVRVAQLLAAEPRGLDVAVGVRAAGGGDGQPAVRVVPLVEGEVDPVEDRGGQAPQVGARRAPGRRRSPRARARPTWCRGRRCPSRRSGASVNRVSAACTTSVVFHGWPVDR